MIIKTGKITPNNRIPFNKIASGIDVGVCISSNGTPNVIPEFQITFPNSPPIPISGDFRLILLNKIIYSSTLVPAAIIIKPNTPSSIFDAIKISCVDLINQSEAKYNNTIPIKNKTIGIHNFFFDFSSN